MFTGIFFFHPYVGFNLLGLLSAVVCKRMVFGFWFYYSLAHILVLFSYVFETLLVSFGRPSM